MDAGVYAALLGLGRTGTVSSSLPVLLLATQEPSPAVRASARDALAAMKDGGINAALKEKLNEAKPASQATILQVLHRRNAPGTAQLLKEAAAASEPEVRVTALSLLGELDDPSLAPLLLEAATKGSPGVRVVALRSYLAIAGGLLGQKKQNSALAMFHRALDLTGDAEQRRAALNGIAAIASPTSLDRVKPLLLGSGVEREAGLAFVAIAGTIGDGGNEKEAIKLLSDLFGRNVSGDVATAAMAKLRALGADTTGFAARAGYLTTWFLLGPFPFDGENPIEKKHVDPGAITLTESVALGSTKLVWNRFVTDDLQGRVVLHNDRLYGRIGNAAVYAYAEVMFHQERKLRLRIGSDDGNVVWLNGERVHLNETSRPLSPDSDSVDVVVKPGTNRLLMKITQGGGEWEFTCRFTDRQNRPVDLQGK